MEAHRNLKDIDDDFCKSMRDESESVEDQRKSNGNQKKPMKIKTINRKPDRCR